MVAVMAECGKNNEGLTPPELSPLREVRRRRWLTHATPSPTDG